MRNVTASVHNVALRHVVEDALKFLEGSDLEPERQEFVISDLKELFQSASHGSQLVETHNLIFNPDEIDAFENFSFVERYVNHAFNGKLKNQLKIISRVFQKLSEEKDISSKEKKMAGEFLRVFLQRIEQGPSILNFPNQEIFEIA